MDKKSNLVKLFAQKKEIDKQTASVLYYYY